MSCKEKGVFYTPPSIADWMVKHAWTLIQGYESEDLKKQRFKRRSNEIKPIHNAGFKTILKAHACAAGTKKADQSTRFRKRLRLFSSFDKLKKRFSSVLHFAAAMQ